MVKEENQGVEKVYVCGLEKQDEKVMKKKERIPVVRREICIKKEDAGGGGGTYG